MTYYETEPGTSLFTLSLSSSGVNGTPTTPAHPTTPCGPVRVCVCVWAWAGRLRDFEQGTLCRWASSRRRITSRDRAANAAVVCRAWGQSWGRLSLTARYLWFGPWLLIPKNVTLRYGIRIILVTIKIFRIRLQEVNRT